MDWIDWLILPAIGAVGGFLAGMLGVGGGIIFVPVLTYYFKQLGMPGDELVKHTLANSILLVFISGVSGILKQRKLGSWNWKKSLSIGIPGALAALIWSYFIEQGNWYKKENFQFVFLAFLIISIVNMVLGKKDHPTKSTTTPNKMDYAIDTGVSILAGSVVSLSGLGGGVIMVPLFRMLLKMPMKAATALSLSIIPLLSLAPLVNYLISKPLYTVQIAHSGYIVWPVVLPIALGVAIFAGVGHKFSKRIPVLYLRIIFAALATIILIKTLYDIYN
jgi:uncharacterized protein